jgi:hypothetical protein
MEFETDRLYIKERPALASPRHRGRGHRHRGDLRRGRRRADAAHRRRALSLPCSRAPQRRAPVIAPGASACALPVDGAIGAGIDAASAASRRAGVGFPGDGAGAAVMNLHGAALTDGWPASSLQTWSWGWPWTEWGDGFHIRTCWQVLAWPMLRVEHSFDCYGHTPKSATTEPGSTTAKGSRPTPAPRRSPAPAARPPPCYTGGSRTPGSPPPATPGPSPPSPPHPAPAPTTTAAATPATDTPPPNATYSPDSSAAYTTA